MARRRRGRKGPKRILKVVGYQRGTSHRKADIRYKAAPPGARVSRSGRVYWETRRSRTDLGGNV